jgi:hypothetical protein
MSSSSSDMAAERARRQVYVLAASRENAALATAPDSFFKPAACVSARVLLAA